MPGSSEPRTRGRGRAFQPPRSRRRRCSGTCPSRTCRCDFARTASSTPSAPARRSAPGRSCRPASSRSRPRSSPGSRRSRGRRDRPSVPGTRATARTCNATTPVAPRIRRRPASSPRHGEYTAAVSVPNRLRAAAQRRTARAGCTRPRTRTTGGTASGPGADSRRSAGRRARPVRDGCCCRPASRSTGCCSWCGSRRARPDRR